MAKIKLSKTELKIQRDALKRFERYLPTLQLKKQQLQLEVRQAREAFERLHQELVEFEKNLEGWIEVLDESCMDLLEKAVTVRAWRVGIRNIAGIDTPEFEKLEFEPLRYDLFTTPTWFDDVLEAVRKHVELRLKEQLLQEQLHLVEQELRVVTQRVNLFEKVKIPEAKENIRRIQISLGDRQTGAVGRAKIAKEKCRVRNLDVDMAS